MCLPDPVRSKKRKTNIYLYAAQLPAPDTSLRLAIQVHNLHGAVSVCTLENDPHTRHKLLFHIAVSHDRFQMAVDIGTDGERGTCSHDGNSLACRGHSVLCNAESHHAGEMGILLWIFCLVLSAKHHAVDWYP